MLETAMVLIGLASLAIVALAPRWRLVVLMLPLIAIYEGAFRKWFLPSMQAYLFFVKDGLILVALIGFLIYQRTRGCHEPLLAGLKILLAVSTAYFAIHIAHPNSPTPAVGILGFKAYMLYASLLLIVPYLHASHAEFDRSLKLFMLLMIPTTLLGLVQFSLPASHLLNVYVATDVEQHISSFGSDNRVRAAGTFSYIGGYAIFVVAMYDLALACVVASGFSLRRNWIALALFLSATMALFTTGSRTVLLGTLGLTPVFLLLVLRAGLLSGLYAVRLIIGSIVIAALAFYFAEEAIDAMAWRTANADSNADRALTPLTELADALETSPLFGTGIGTNTNGSWVMAGIRSLNEAYWLNGHMYEVETARVMQEVGMVGFLLVYTVRIALIIWAVKMVFTLRTRLFKSLSAVIASFLFLHLGLFVIHNPTAGILYWYATGLLFGMYRLDSQSAGPFPQPASRMRWSRSQIAADHGWRTLVRR